MSPPGDFSPCVCGRPSEWGHHVAGRANFPKVIADACRRHADFLDAFLRHAGVKLKHDEPRTAADLVWAAIVGLEALRAARDGRAGLSPEVVEVGRLIVALGGDARVSREVTRTRAARPTAKPEDPTLADAALVIATGELLQAFPRAGERLPRLCGLFGRLAKLPLDRLADMLRTLDGNPEIVELCGRANQAASELLAAWRAAEAGDPDAQAALELIVERFAHAARVVLDLIEDALDEDEEPGEHP